MGHSLKIPISLGPLSDHQENTIRYEFNDIIGA